MDGGDGNFLSDILLNGEDGTVAGLDDTNLDSLKTLKLMRKCKLATVQREPRRQRIFIGWKMKSYASAG
jgi:hypothetical protein